MSIVAVSRLPCAPSMLSNVDDPREEIVESDTLTTLPPHKL